MPVYRVTIETDLGDRTRTVKVAAVNVDDIAEHPSWAAWRKAADSLRAEGVLTGNLVACTEVCSRCWGKGEIEMVGDDSCVVIVPCVCVRTKE